MEKSTLTVLKESAGNRLDSFVAGELDDVTRSAAQSLLEAGNLLVNGKREAKNYKVREGDVILVSRPDPVSYDAAPQRMPLVIVYEDAHLLVVDKPKGMVVHPAAGNPDKTLVNGLLYHCQGQLSGINGVMRPGIVHRIDKDTSGLLVVAKDDVTHAGLSAQLKEHSMDRIYQAVVHGNIKEDAGRVDAPIGRHPIDRKKMCVTDKNARNAVTNFEVLERFGRFTYLRLKLETGRTHQIRVHMAYLGHPLAGDLVYGPQKTVRCLEGQCLHAGTLGFTHPVSGERLFFESPLPPYFIDFLQKLRKESGV